jgi:catechol 2,3-dioxygenase-like lactoylglutathione lyase family enzyme
MSEQKPFRVPPDNWRRRPVRGGEELIAGSHVILYSRDAGADRAFFADVLGLRSVDAGGGWLIFALPPSEVAIHPGKNDRHELYLMCTDLRATMKVLKARRIRCDAPSEQHWGILTAIRLPGGGRLGLYQPKHPTAARLKRARRPHAARVTRRRR